MTVTNLFFLVLLVTNSCCPLQKLWDNNDDEIKLEENGFFLS